MNDRAAAESGWRQRPGTTLTSAPFLIVTMTLILNDWWLKGEFPGVVTGKLSDFAGIAVLAIPMFAAMQRRAWLVYLLLAAGFAWWKSPLSASFIALASEWLPMRIGRVIDYSDLMALCLLPYWQWLATSRPSRHVSSSRLRRQLLIPVSVVALLGVMGTSKVEHQQGFTIRTLGTQVLSREDVVRVIFDTAKAEKFECIDCTQPLQSGDFKGSSNGMYYKFESDTDVSFIVYELRRDYIGETRAEEAARLLNALRKALLQRFSQVEIVGEFHR
jgi:hypothetical protein